MHVTAIVLAAGEGLRLKSKVSKPLVKIGFQPAIIYSLNTLSKHPFVKDIIVVANHKNLSRIRTKIKEYRINKVRDVILGGSLRQDSVVNGLGAIDRKTQLVLIHDAARPFISKGLISSLVKSAKIWGAAIAGVPVKATIKEVHSPCLSGRQAQSTVHSELIVKRTINRENIWEIQTPQVFKRELIMEAYKKFGSSEVTDDASLVEKLGHKVRVVIGSYNNIKITTPEDLVLAEAILKSYKL